MLLVLYMLIGCMTQVSIISDHESKDDKIMKICRDGVSQITLECDRCMNQDWCRSWFYGSQVPGAKCFDFCNSITQQIQCLSDKKQATYEIENLHLGKRIGRLEAELEICTGNFELATINNQTTIVSLQLLNENVVNVEVQLRELKSHIDFVNSTFEREFAERLNGFKLGITRLLDEQINHTEHSVENVSKTLQAEILKESTRIKKQLMSNVSSSESNIKMYLADLTQSNDKTINQIKNDQFKSESRLNTTIQELSDSVRNVNESSLFEVEIVKKHFGEIIANIQKELERHKSQLESLKSDINDEITTTSIAWEQKLDSMSTDLEQKLEQNNVNVNKTMNALENKIDSSETNFQTIKWELQRQIGKVKNKCWSSIHQQKSTLKQKLEEQSRKLDKNIQVINDRITQITEDIERKLNDKVKHLEESDKLFQDLAEDKARTLESKIGNIDTGIQEKVRVMETNITQRLSEEVEKITRWTQEVSKILTTQQEKVDIIYPNTFNKEMLQMAFLCLAVLVMINFAMVYYYRPSAAHMTPTIMESANIIGNAERRFQSSIQILRQVPSKPQLQAAVCIISFDEGRQGAHQQLLDSANLVNCRVVSFVVRRHANIPDLPKCKVYLMCTEFTERHVIIEEQGLGLGDLHRTTYDAVLKLGGQLIILYTKDPGSRRLKEDENYNKNIYCVAHQQELVELNNLGRFFSVYDTLTAQQKTKLMQTIMDCLQ